MDRIYLASWLMPDFKEEDDAVEFFRTFSVCKQVKRATLQASAMGVYSARVNGERVSYVLAPGWTAYEFRVQYQEYDVTHLLRESNTLSLTAAAGWRTPNRFEGNKVFRNYGGPEIKGNEYAVIASLLITYTDGTEELIRTDESWLSRKTKWRYCDIYKGDLYDETYEESVHPVRVIRHPKGLLVPQQGEIIAEQERLKPVSAILTPKGERVLDFGQNLVGYLSFTLTVPKGARLVIDHAEVLDRDGNFYNANYRTADARITYIGDGKEHTWKPEFTFYGFRYIRLTELPESMTVDPAAFTAIVVHSDMERTGYFECSDERINQLYHNIIWGQKGNFLDVPTDCPQRDERLGWTGDAQVFARCAAYNFNTKRFFDKWLTDMALEQRPSGSIPHIIPRLDWASCACGWADAATIVPWQIYLLYGDKELLRKSYTMIKRWIDYMYAQGDAYIGGKHFGDWLSHDAEDPNSCRGGTDSKFIALAFRAYSTSLFLRISEILGIREHHDYREKLDKTKERIRTEYFKDGMVDLATQTAHVLTLKFELCEKDKLQAHADRLADMIRKNGDRLTTGFLGTPYLLHMLTAYGYTELAYTLLFQTKCPSWLYSVERGATTMWERWDGIREDGSFQDVGMNSFNHYAYGAVGDWLYGAVAGIETVEEHPGFEHIRFCPKATVRLNYAKASVKTKYGTVASEWHRENGKTVYTFTAPDGCHATAELGGTVHELEGGIHIFTEDTPSA
ncbi:MAG: family 78 glycoside hydrolase catalytic domain [Clostridia bacterium]|nr:family 78 glycoside hydrolase catalytic domain [Clostridia bacterium]